MTVNETTNPNRLARITGLLYVLPWALSIFAFMLRKNLLVPGDAAATANNIMASASLFRLSIVSDLIVQAVFVFLVLLLYQLLKPVSKKQAALMAILFLVSVPIAMLNLLNQAAALILASGADYLSAFTTDQLQALAALFRDLHEIGIMTAYIFWGTLAVSPRLFGLQVGIPAQNPGHSTDDLLLRLPDRFLHVLSRPRFRVCRQFGHRLGRTLPVPVAADHGCERRTMAQTI